MSAKTRESLLRCINKILEVRDKAGLTIHEVCLTTRYWEGEQIGDGKCREKTQKITPTPSIREFAHDIRATEGAAIQQGDILLTGISRANYDRDFLSTQQTHPNIEKFYVIDGREYRLVSIIERFVTWDVLVRQTISKETRRPPGGFYG